MEKNDKPKAHGKVMHAKFCSLDQRPEHIGTVNRPIVNNISEQLTNKLKCTAVTFWQLKTKSLC